MPSRNTNTPEINERATISVAVETSGRTGSVALGIGDSIVSKATLSGFQKHSSELLPAIKGLLSENHLVADNINHIYIPNGPGSFTGIRIAVAMAKMASFAADVKIVAVDTLEAIAYNAIAYFKSQNIDYSKVASILDAKRGLFYIALFEWKNNHIHRISTDMLVRPADFLEHYAHGDTRLHLLGEGLLYYRSQFESPNIAILDQSFWPASAQSVWHLARTKAAAGQFADPNALIPLYIRKPEAEENWEKANR